MRLDPGRVFGLDLMRATAILLVLVCHGAFELFPVRPIFAISLYAYGYFGVDLFFALSGFLIGGMLFRALASKREHRPLRNFWIRRVFRTMPNYYYCQAGFIATSLGAATLLPLLDSWRMVPPGGGIVMKLSLWAYALYLANMPVLKVLQHFSPTESPLANSLIFFIVCFVLADFVYTFFEKPMMDLRERWPFRRGSLDQSQAALERQASGI